MKPLKLILAYTAHAKDLQEWGDIKALTEEQTEHSYRTILTLDYSNGEPFGLSQVHPNPKAGRKAAKTFMNYCNCQFEDRTKK